MELHNVFDHFADEQNDRSWWPVPPDDPVSIGLMVAGVRLSGRMLQCRTETDLQDAVNETMEKVRRGELTTWSWAQEGQQVKAELEMFYDALDAELARREGPHLWN
ncbi:MAG: hypothetical protein KKE86_07625 [Planctomycetes bacterium]|nr:hypothetical protein [Planctomycetota bacterium]MBU4399189.1 hypothetical protein [Planctomycetota bacterium]MCG2682892.1 hypothetical protein [Planctomycetales bacterium]